jgi:hypothetical protein
MFMFESSHTPTDDARKDMKHRADIDGYEQRTADTIERSQEQYERDIDDADVADRLADEWEEDESSKIVKQKEKT